MKKLNLFLVVIFALCFIPYFSINALEETSDINPINGETVSFNTAQASYSMKFTKINYEVEPDAAIGWVSGTVLNKTNEILDLYEVVYYYNQDKQEIGFSENYQTVTNQNNGTYSDTFDVNLYSNDLKSGYSISDIAYYSLFVKNVKPYQSDNNNAIDIIGDGEYALTKYKIDIKVNKNNTFNITEYITAYFNVDKHGIFRKIPLRNEVVRLDGTKSNNRAKISDIKVNEQFTTYNESGDKVIKIGDSNFTLTGSKDYIINYLYNIGKDTSKEYDEFYFNIIGYKWDTTISNAEFTITMPKEFDKSKLGFSSGPQGSTENSNVIYTVNGNIITGSYNGLLNAGEALTIRLELPDGYFVGASSNFDMIMILAIIVPIIFAILAGMMWYRYGRDEKAIETVEFYPPEGFNSVEVGFLYKGTANSNDVVSLLIYLANKGYISIAETEEQALFSKTKGFKITKVKEYDGNNPNERLFLSGLFKDKMPGVPFSSIKEMFSSMKNPQEYAEKVANAPVIEKHEVTSTDLYDNFYTTLNAIVASINSKENKEKIFEKTSLNKNFPVILMIIVAFLLITFKPVSETSGLGLLIPAVLFPGIGFTIFFLMIFGKNQGSVYVNGKPSNSKVTKVILGLMFIGLFGGMPWAFIVLPGLLNDPLYLLTYVIGIICIIAMLFFMQHMSKRTTYGNEVLGKIKGFKNFLETAEKPKLEELVMHNPSYFYNILPFTYVLGVSDKWIKKFESIALQSPNWYSGTGTFNAVTFGNFMNSTMTAASTAMSSSPSSSSSGGGSSGGGSGGGGGGSW